jgi:TonB family protein
MPISIIHSLRTRSMTLVATALLAAVCGQSILVRAAQSSPKEAVRSQQTRNQPVDGAFSSVAGTVSDRFGGLLSGVQLTLTNDASGEVRTVTTAPDATFEFANLPGGKYSLQLSRPGFTRTYLGLELNDDERNTQTLTMQVDDVKEALRVVFGREPATSPSASGRQTAPRPGESSRARVCGADGTGCVTPAQKVAEVRPQYPASASSRGIEGTVIAEATIDEQGSISDVRVLRSADEQLDTAVVEAVRQWLFVPTMLNGAPTASLLNLTVEFVIAGR